MALDTVEIDKFNWLAISFNVVTFFFDMYLISKIFKKYRKRFRKRLLNFLIKLIAQNYIIVNRFTPIITKY